MAHDRTGRGSGGRGSNKINKTHECRGELEPQEVELHHSVKKEGKIKTLRNRSFGFTGDGSKLWKEGDTLPFSVKWRNERKPTEKTVEHQTGRGFQGTVQKMGCIYMDAAQSLRRS